MTTHWLDYIAEAERWLGLAKNRADVPAKAAECLYEAMVSVTRAVMELEGNGAERSNVIHKRNALRDGAS